MRTKKFIAAVLMLISCGIHAASIQGKVVGVADGDPDAADVDVGLAGDENEDEDVVVALDVAVDEAQDVAMDVATDVNVAGDVDEVVAAAVALGDSEGDGDATHWP